MHTLFFHTSACTQLYKLNTVTHEKHVAPTHMKV